MKKNWKDGEKVGRTGYIFREESLLDLTNEGRAKESLAPITSPAPLSTRPVSPGLFVVQDPKELIQLSQRTSSRQKETPWDECMNRFILK